IAAPATTARIVITPATRTAARSDGSTSYDYQHPRPTKASAGSFFRRRFAVPFSRMTRPTVLVLPGLGCSGPDHWQSAWEREHGYVRVQQEDWHRPDRDAWIAARDRD